MIVQLQIDVNKFAFFVEDAVPLDIRPEDNLIPITRPADEQPALVYVATLGKSSQRTMYSALVLIAGLLSRSQCTPLTLPWGNLRRAHVIAVRAWLVEHKAPATGNRMLAALKGVLKEAWRMGQIDRETYARAIDIPTIAGTPREQAAGRALSRSEKLAILDLLDTDKPIDIRNTAIFGLAAYGGLRRAEIASLTVDAYDPTTSAMHVIGKGRKARVIYIAAGVDNALADWLTLRQQTPGPLFTQILKNGRIVPHGITPEAIYAIMLDLQQRAGLRRFTPHDLRRTFAGDLLDEGVDIATVQKLMGHSNTNTTGRYDRRGERAKRAAIRLLHMPYECKFTEET